MDWRANNFGIESRGVDRRAMPPCSFDVKLSESAMTVKVKSAKVVTKVVNFILEVFGIVECADLVGFIRSKAQRMRLC